MSVPIPLRVDFDAVQLRGLARKTKDGPRARRLLALAAIYDGATRTEAAKRADLSHRKTSCLKGGAAKNPRSSQTGGNYCDRPLTAAAAASFNPFYGFTT